MLGLSVGPCACESFARCGAHPFPVATKSTTKGVPLWRLRPGTAGGVRVSGVQGASTRHSSGDDKRAGEPSWRIYSMNSGEGQMSMTRDSRRTVSAVLLNPSAYFYLLSPCPCSEPNGATAPADCTDHTDSCSARIRASEKTLDKPRCSERLGRGASHPLSRRYGL